MFSYLFVISCICIYVYTHIDIYIYMCCFVSCQWYLPVIKNYQQSEKAMKEKRFNKSSTISIDIALRKKLIGNDKNNREKKSMLSV